MRKNYRFLHQILAALLSSSSYFGFGQYEQVFESSSKW
jgi:hypothetical protein